MNANAPVTPHPPPKVPSRPRWGLRFLMLVLWLAAALAAWTWLTLSWAYSEGDRAGVLQKFSRKGWVCKTWEGELAQYVVPGMAPQIWLFSVRDSAIAEQLGKQVGEKLRIHYTEHRGIPVNCFGETSYFATRLDPQP